MAVGRNFRPFLCGSSCFFYAIPVLTSGAPMGFIGDGTNRMDTWTLGVSYVHSASSLRIVATGRNMRSGFEGRDWKPYLA